jgi:hypothetical protein
VGEFEELLAEVDGLTEEAPGPGLPPGHDRLPIFEPVHNLRQVTKQLLLLEDHLNHPSQRCDDCIRKHLLTAEAYAEEAVGLDVNTELGALAETLPASLRDLQRQISEGTVDKREIAQACRKIRKVTGKHTFSALGERREPAPSTVSSPGSVSGRRGSRASGGLSPLAKRFAPLKLTRYRTDGKPPFNPVSLTGKQLAAVDMIDHVLSMNQGEVIAKIQARAGLGVSGAAAARRARNKLALAMVLNAWYESNLDPHAVGDNGASVGLFQLHERGEGAGLSVDERSDPAVNTGRILEAFWRRFKHFAPLVRAEVSQDVPVAVWTARFAEHVERPHNAAVVGKSRGRTATAVFPVTIRRRPPAPRLVRGVRNEPFAATMLVAGVLVAVAAAGARRSLS